MSRDARQLNIRKVADERLAARSQFGINDRLVPNIERGKSNSLNHTDHDPTIALQRAIYGALGELACVARSRNRYLDSTNRREHDECPGQGSGEQRTGDPV